jgi:penicillin-binding protein 1C
LDAPRLNSEYRPKNFNRHFNGPVSTTFALQKSLNLPAVQVLEAYGPERFDANLKNSGVHLAIPGKANLSLALGGAGISLASLVSLYSSLANGGQVIPLLSSQLDAIASSRFLMSPQAAWVTYKMLSSAPRPDRMQASFFNLGINPIAWKTGTSYGYRDAWAVGVSKNYTVGVWVGRPDGTPQPGHYGSATAAPILFKVMESLPGKRETVPIPPDISLQDVCWPLGLNKSVTQAEHCHMELQAWVVGGKVPPTLMEPGLKVWRANPYKIWLDKNTHKLLDQDCSSIHKTSKTIALWPGVIEPWIKYKRRFYGQLPAVDESCLVTPEVTVRPLNISSLQDGNSFRLANADDELPIKLEALGGQGRRDWYINGEFISSSKSGIPVYHSFKGQGAFEIVVLDERGNIAKIMVELRL